MNKRLRSMIDEIFSELKMTAENLALRDELLSNAQARYEDAMAQGKTEEEAFREIAASLEDVYDLLEQMGASQAQPEEPAAAPQDTIQDAIHEEAPDAKAQPESAGMPQTDLGEALSKAFTALGDFSQAMMPEAKKLYGQMDEATGGVLGKLGRAAKKGMRDAQKAAGEAIDKLSRESGELVFDFGANREAKEEKTKEEEFVSDFGTVTQPEAVCETDGELVMDMDAIHADEAEPAKEETDEVRAAAMENAAEDLCAQAAIKEVAGDEAGAAELRMRAEALRMEASLLRLSGETAAEADKAPADEAEKEAAGPDYVQEDGEIDEDAFARAVDDLTRDAQEVIHQAAKKVQDAFAGATSATGTTSAAGAEDYVVRNAGEPVSGVHSIPAAGLRKIDVQLDADDVEIVCADGAQVETIWEAQNVDGEPAITYSDHTLTISRKNPDVFKTFFSVFKKEGGRITVRVPRGYAADYAISTTSGDVHIAGVDVDGVKITTTSGSVRVEPDAKLRAADIAVTTVSGHATVSACADTVAVTTVSGGQFVSCDAHRVDVNVVSGRVHVEGACDEWEVSAVSGDVELLCTVAPTKKVQISSVHGDVRLALPGEIRGFVAEATGALGCEIINEFGPNRYGTCALPIRMETMHGKLLITRL